MAVGRDVYLDTRLQIPKLEALFPDVPRLGAQGPDQLALERLLSSLTTDTGLFGNAVQLLPLDLPLLNDPAYYRDRGDFLGRVLSTEGMKAGRPEALGEMARAFGFLETTLLADGRDWILSTEKPSLADIEAVWPFHWLIGLPGALPADRFSPSVYPRVYAWIQRFQNAVTEAKKQLGKPKSLTGEEAATAIFGAAYSEAEKGVDAQDAKGLSRGDAVVVRPTDTGASGKDRGFLIGIDGEEVVLDVDGDGGSVRVHAPRHGFRVKSGEARL